MDIEPTSRYQSLDALSEGDDFLANFRDLWHDDCLLMLRERCTDLHYIDFDNKVQIKFKKVLIKNPAKARSYWKHGNVDGLLSGNDGNVLQCA